MAEFGVNDAGSYAILYCVMITFMILALIASSWIPVPVALQKFMVSSDGKTTVASDSNADFFLSARNSANGKY